MRPTIAMVMTCLLTFLMIPSSAWSWSAIGHRMVAETAALILEQPDWQGFFSRHRYEVGFYSFVPDAHFRHKDGNNSALEGSTHAFQIDLLPAQTGIEAIPRNYSEAKKHLEEKLGAETFAQIGTAPWRAEQFQTLAREELKTLQKLGGSYQAGRTSTGDPLKVFKATYFLGLMAHYVGDAAQPYHATTDGNGWATGQGGIHFYFEATCVEALEPDLSQDVLAAAKKNKARWLADWNATHETPAGFVMRVFADSAQALDQVRKIDKAHAVVKSSGKEPARRRPPQQGCPYFRNLLIERLAKGAVATAHLWESTLPKSVDFTTAARLQFSDMEHNFEFIPPSYDVNVLKNWVGNH